MDIANAAWGVSCTSDVPKWQSCLVASNLHWLCQCWNLSMRSPHSYCDYLFLILMLFSMKSKWFVSHDFKVVF